MKLTEGRWTEIKEARIQVNGNDYGAWLRGMDTECGEIYFVEHEAKGKELKLDCLVMNDYGKAEKDYKKALKEMMQFA